MSSITLKNLVTGEVLFEAESSKPYEIRRPKGLSEHAHVRRFQKGKPRYRHFRGLLVMARPIR
jgi:hypothetical protein